MELAGCACRGIAGEDPTATRIAAVKQIRPAFMSDLLKEKKV